MALTPTMALDIEDIRLGIAGQGAKSGIGFQLFLKDKSSIVFVLTDHQASALTKEVEGLLVKLRAEAPSQTKN